MPGADLRGMDLFRSSPKRVHQLCVSPLLHLVRHVIRQAMESSGFLLGKKFTITSFHYKQ
jgi:hypothetical protein